MGARFFFHLLTLVCTLSHTKGSSVDFDLVDWLNGRDGGYWNPKQQIRYADPDDPNSMRGVFATEPIEEGEVLCHVPWHSLISSLDNQTGTYTDYEKQLSCGTIRNLARELHLGEESHLGAYITYLKAQPLGLIPSAWSQSGKKLLQEVLGGDADHQSLPPFSPTSWLDRWVQWCDGDASDVMSVLALMLTVQRSDEDILVPLYDMYNHQNGDKLNTIAGRVHGHYHQTRAKQDIKVGEQIYNSYNLCYQCRARYSNYGTPEILRDYGFVERMPQRWYFFGSTPRLEIDLDESGYKNVSMNVDIPSHSRLWRTMVDHFEAEIDRLLRVRSRLMHVQEDTLAWSVPPRERDIIWSYHQAALEALASGLTYLGTGAHLPANLSVVESDLYVDLSKKSDSLALRRETFPIKRDFFPNDDYVVEEFQTPEVSIRVEEFTSDEDTCLFLNGTLQVCRSFRPHYYESLVHLPAQFLPTVQRVLVVGSGNPMVITETLRYKHVENIVAVGLNEGVTTTVHRNFGGTSTYFWDGRVEWWYGDVLATIGLFPDHYMASFDLVIVEEIVATELILQALSCFARPAGMVVTDSPRFENKIFKYAAQHFHDCPVLCSKAVSLGTQQNDFTRSEIHDHDVELSHGNPASASLGSLDWINDFWNNKELSSGNCSTDDLMGTSHSSGEGSDGVLMVMELEDFDSDLFGTLPNGLYSIAEQLGLTPQVVESSGLNGSEVVLGMAEGYIVAKAWLEHQYCGVDVFMHRSIEKLSTLSHAVTALMDAEDVSSHRHVVRRAHLPVESDSGESLPERSLTFEPDPHAECNNSALDHSFVEETIEVLLDEFDSNNVSIVMVCGRRNESECLARDVGFELEGDYETVALWSCTNSENSTDSSDMRACEARISKGLKIFSKRQKVGLIVIDESAPLSMLQILDSIFSSQVNRDKFLRSDSIMMALSVDPEAALLRRNLFDEIRSNMRYYPVYRAEFNIASNGVTRAALNVLSLKGEGVDDFQEMESTLRETLSHGQGNETELRAAVGGLGQFHLEMDFKVPSDISWHDTAEAYHAEEEADTPLYWQNVLWLHVESNSEFQSPDLEATLTTGLTAPNHTRAAAARISQQGEGLICFCDFDDGSAVVLWDGGHQITVNLYVPLEAENSKENWFVKSFLNAVKTTGTITSRVEGPRGEALHTVSNSSVHTREHKGEWYHSMARLGIKKPLKTKVEATENILRGRVNRQSV